MSTRRDKVRVEFTLAQAETLLEGLDYMERGNPALIVVFESDKTRHTYRRARTLIENSVRAVKQSK